MGKARTTSNYQSQAKFDQKYLTKNFVMATFAETLVNIFLPVAGGPVAGALENLAFYFCLLL